jgi:hypothetical protein
MLVDVAAGMLYVVMKRHMSTISWVNHATDASTAALESSPPSSVDHSVLTTTLAATLRLSQEHLSYRLDVYFTRGRTKGWGTQRVDATTSMPKNVDNIDAAAASSLWTRAC